MPGGGRGGTAAARSGGSGRGRRGEGGHPSAPFGGRRGGGFGRGWRGGGEATVGSVRGPPGLGGEGRPVPNAPPSKQSPCHGRRPAALLMASRRANRPPDRHLRKFRPRQSPRRAGNPLHAGPAGRGNFYQGIVRDASAGLNGGQPSPRRRPPCTAIPSPMPCSPNSAASR